MKEVEEKARAEAERTTKEHVEEKEEEEEQNYDRSQKSPPLQTKNEKQSD